MKYCTYITTYSGNLLPPFYIGFVKTEKILKGYRGSVSSIKYKQIWIEELNNNPHLFKTTILKYFDNHNGAAAHEEMLLRHFCAHKNPMYINMSIGNKLVRRDTKHTDETKRKLSDAHKGKPSPRKGKKSTLESIQKMKDSKKKNPTTPWNKGISTSSMIGDKVSSSLKKYYSDKPGTMTGRKHTEETKQLFREQRKGRPAHNKGQPTNKGIKRSEETKQKMRKPKSEQHRENMRLAWIKRKQTKEK